jgi:hypothetical protein
LRRPPRRPALPVPPPAEHDEAAPSMSGPHRRCSGAPRRDRRAADPARRDHGRRPLVGHREDLSTAPFAGQYCSFLDVAPSEVERAVRLTWASLAPGAALPTGASMASRRTTSRCRSSSC